MLGRTLGSTEVTLLLCSDVIVDLVVTEALLRCLIQTVAGCPNPLFGLPMRPNVLPELLATAYRVC